MPKISGLGLGEIKKISGLGLGPIKKVSGLGLGLIWQDAVQVGMVKSGTHRVTTTQSTVPGWTAEDANSTVSGSSLVIPSAGNWTLELSVVISVTGSFGSVWSKLWIVPQSTPAIEGLEVPYNRGSSGNVYSLASPTPIACTAGELISIQADTQTLSATDITGGWLRAIPV